MTYNAQAAAIASAPSASKNDTNNLIEYSHTTSPASVATTNVTYSAKWYSKSGETYTELSSAPTNAGTYYVEITSTDGYKVAGATSDKVAFTINKAALTVTPHATIIVGSATPLTDNTVTVSYTADGLVPGESLATTDCCVVANITITGYTVDKAVGTGYEKVVLNSTGEAALEAINTNYDITGAQGTFDVVVGNIVLDGDNADVTLTPYNATYDATSHNLSAQYAFTTKFDASVVTASFKNGDTAATTFKNVADSANYTVILTKNNANLTFTQTGSNWTISQDGTTATYTGGLSVAITQYKLTTPTLSVNSTNHKQLDWTAVSLLTGDTDTVNYVVKIDSTAQTAQTTTSFVANAAGKYYVKATTSNANYSDSDYTAESTNFEAIAVTFYKNEKSDSTKSTAGTYDKAISRDATPTGMPTTTLYYFNGQKITETNPSLKNYDFDKWLDATGAEFVASSTNTNAFAGWTVQSGEDEVTVTFYYSIDGTLQAAIKSITFYSNDTDTTDLVKSLTPTHTWFATNGSTWYSDSACTTSVANTFAAYYALTTKNLYGYENFAMGRGDVNGDGKVNTDDLSIYRQQIVGGYGLNEVAKDAEISTDSKGSTLDFLKRVADVNVQANGTTFGDGKYDVRDVCTIAMAIADGYGLEIKDNAYSNKQIDIKPAAPTVTAVANDNTSTVVVNSLSQPSQKSATINIYTCHSPSYEYLKLNFTCDKSITSIVSSLSCIKSQNIQDSGSYYNLTIGSFEKVSDTCFSLTMTFEVAAYKSFDTTKDFLTIKNGTETMFTLALSGYADYMD